MRTPQRLRALLSLLRIRVAEGLQYRLAGLSSASIGFFWGVIEITAISVLFTHGDRAAAAVNGMTLPQMVSYIWIGQVMLPFFGGSGSINSEILDMIRSGNVGIELCRPMDVYTFWYARTLSGNIAPFLLRGVPVVLAAALMPAACRLSGPASAAGFFLFIASLLAAVLLSCAFLMLVTMVRLDLRWGDGPMHMLTLLSGILAGTYLPLQLWPDALQGFLALQPFAGQMDIPARLYVGTLPPSEAGFFLLVQLAWTAVFTLAGRLLLRRRLKTIVVQGG